MLRDVQENMKETLLRRRGELTAINQQTRELFVEGSIAIDERLKIYHANVIGNISKALAMNYPLLEKLVGEEFLMMLCREYAIATPPLTGCLTDYGDIFPEFVRMHPQTQSLPYISDVAELERALQKAYYAKDDEALQAPDLASVPEEKLYDIFLHPRSSVHLLCSEYPLVELQTFCQNPETTTPPDMETSKTRYFMTLRPKIDVEITPLEPDEYNMISHLKKLTLGEALEHTTQTFPDFDVTTFLQKHLSIGTFCAFQKSA